MLHTILSGETCAACQNCCVFEEQSAWELPTFPAEAAARLIDRTEYRLTEEHGRYRITLPYDNSHDNSHDGTPAAQPCPFLNPASGCTLPESEKPFACKLWPVRLMRDAEGQPQLALYRGCPGIPADAHEALDRLLADGLRARIFEEAARDPSLILPYHPNYQFL